MKNALIFIKICLFTFSSFICSAQNFVNGDLEGTISGVSTLPPNWQNVPFTDVNCQANLIGMDSPDLTDITGPDVGAGILGNPYSGSTFMSGLYGGNPFTEFFQEGIMQNVSGLEIGQTYTISFHQAVIKQVNALDGSGSWAVYIDSVLAGITIPTFSNAPYDTISFNWELRSITYTATATSHLIKFLPVDDDTNTDLTFFDITGAVRMGIDAISPAIALKINLNSDAIPNIFTPNNDGFNDVFSIKTSDMVTLNCKIYNRWGILVNELTHINEGWDGNTTSGLQCTAGVYYWTAEYENSIGANNSIRGFLQLLR